MPKESNKLDVNQESQLNSESKIFFLLCTCDGSYTWSRDTRNNTRTKRK